MVLRGRAWALGELRVRSVAPPERALRSGLMTWRYIFKSEFTFGIERRRLTGFLL